MGSYVSPTALTYMTLGELQSSISRSLKIYRVVSQIGAKLICGSILVLWYFTPPVVGLHLIGVMILESQARTALRLSAVLVDLRYRNYVSRWNEPIFNVFINRTVLTQVTTSKFVDVAFRFPNVSLPKSFVQVTLCQIMVLSPLSVKLLANKIQVIQLEEHNTQYISFIES